MIYVLFNHDGSVKRKNITDILQKGNSYVNKIFVSIDGYEPSAYTFVAYCLLPDGTTTTMVSENATQVINGVSYNGVNITITQSETVYAGIIKINIRAVQNENVLVTYTLALAINESVIESSDPIYMSIEQYENLLDIVLFKSSVLSTYTYTDNITSTVFDAQLDGQGFINFNLGDTTKVVLSADEALYRFSLKQDKLIAGTHISINENNVIDVKDIESTIDSVDLTDSAPIDVLYKRITQEQIDLLKHNVLNFIVYQGLMYLPISGDKLKYSYVDYSIVKTIVIDEENLRWSFEGDANLSDIATHTSQINSLIPTVNALNVYNHIDISSHLDLSYIQTANRDDIRAYMIETPHQIIFDIHIYGQSSSVPNGIISYDILKENIGNRLPRLYSSDIVAYGEYNYRFGSSYKKGMAFAQYSISNQSFGIQVINNDEQTSLEPKTLDMDVKIVINLLN